MLGMKSLSPSENSFLMTQKEVLTDLSDFNESQSETSCAKRRGKWTEQEDELLRKYAVEYEEKNWRKVSEKVPGRSPIQCLHRWTKILKPGLVKGPWTNAEDQKLLHWVNENGNGKWSEAAKHIEGRSGKQCRERWFNVLCPEVKKGVWTKEEDELIFTLYQQYGSSWSRIAKAIPGRTENAVKNRYYSALRKLENISKKRADLLLLEMDKETENKTEAENLKLAEENDYESEAQKNEDLRFSIKFKSGLKTFFNSNMVHINEANPKKAPEIQIQEPIIERDKKEKVLEQKDQGKAKKSYYKSKKKINREKSDKFFESFKALQTLEPQNQATPKRCESQSDDRIVNSTPISQEFHQASSNCVETSSEGLEEIPSNSSSYQHLSYQINFSNCSQSSFESLVHKSPNFLPPQQFQIEPISIRDTTTPSKFDQFEQDQLSVEYNNLIYEKVSFGARMLTSALTFPSRIIKECSLMQANGTQIISNLIKLLDTFADHNIDTLILTTQCLAVKNGITESIFNVEMIRELVLKMSEALNYASNIHYTYSRSFLGISKSILGEGAKEKMTYLFGQLSSLQKIISKVMGQIANLQESSNFENDTPSGPNEIIKIEEPENKTQSTNTTNSPVIKTMKITIGHFNSNLEQISKTRVLG